MTEQEQKELARKITVLYDSMKLVWADLDRKGQLNKSTDELFWASRAAWGEVLNQLGVYTDTEFFSLRFTGDVEVDADKRARDPFFRLQS